MADTAPMAWRIMQATAERLRLIRTSDGARTDLGADVRLEAQPFDPSDTTGRITLYTASVVHPDGARSPSERELTLIIELTVPAAWDAAQATTLGAAEDVEDMLGDWMPFNGALPLRFRESIFLERPDGMPCIVTQMMFGTGWRR
ncbi:hypothetical protein [Xanthomonas albilineans]|uniref:Uncharacterized protein n=2 Tax=Xanthomonas albilineans TaxID=29447 RepID=D2U9V3_XANAP|nr:hypothetical protein [Xanthomonas albilineans]CBA14764.1 hypothetical protein XALC_0219 [Xanthomonas albilineans GPE PC73]